MRATQLEVGLAIRQLQWRHHRDGNRRMRSEVGLSLIQWEVLRHLHDYPDASLHDLAVQTFQTDQSMGELAKRMVAGGLVERIDGPGRAVRHRPTASGEKAFHDGSGVVASVLNESIGALTASERATLLTLVNKAIEA